MRRFTTCPGLGALLAAGLLGLGPVLVPGPRAELTWGEDAVRYDAAAETLSVHLREADFTEVLAEIERQSGKRIDLIGEVAAPVTARFSALPLRTGLVQMLSGINHLMAEDGRTGIRIWILESLGGAPTPLPPPAKEPEAGGQEAVMPDTEELEQLIDEIEDPETLQRTQDELESLRVPPRSVVEP